MRRLERPEEVENADYLRGYRDGLRDRQNATRRHSGDGILGALLAIALIAGVGYLAYNYANTGKFLPQVDSSSDLIPRTK
jgi:hypothetical protein